MSAAADKGNNMDSTHEGNHPAGHAKPAGSRSRWVFVAFVAIAAFFLFTEHRAHLFGVLPYLLLLACPLMHFFHHGGHGRSHGNHDSGTRDKAEGEKK